MKNTHKNANIVQLKEMISSYDWSILLEGSLNEACINFAEIFSNLLKLFLPRL